MAVHFVMAVQSAIVGKGHKYVNYDHPGECSTEKDRLR